MARRLDREIEAWSRKSARDKLSLLWDEDLRNGVKVFSYWEGTEWASTYIISASESRKPLPGKWWSLCFVEFGQPEPSEFLRSDDSEGTGAPPPLSDAREIRQLIEVPGIEKRYELCDLMIALGRRRDEMDIPAFTRFAGHEDPVVRYVAMAMLAWNPSVANDYLGGKFGDDPDPVVRDLARRWSGGRLRRRTRV
ncbi:MAG: HEAT repeat domain-containing protein [Solirubrobacterales bacterium]|nr:HEAT repeat domain-containing protein [Solirubrobacterales bacterium]